MDSTYNTVDDFYGAEIEALKPAPEPSDIIWENTSTPKKQVKKNAIYLGLLILVLSVVVFIITIKMLQAKQIVKYLTMPPKTNCDVVNSAFDNNQDSLKSFAYLEWT